MPNGTYKPYPRYKDSGVEWLGDVPEGWEVKRLRFISRINPLASELQDFSPEDEVSFVPMECVCEYGGLRLEQTKPMDEIGSGYTYFRDGDVVFAKITPCFENGKGTLAEGLVNGVAFGTTELHVIRPDDTLEKRFLFYLTICDNFRKIGESEMYGAGGQKRVPTDFVQNFPVPLPPLPEQAAIAAFLDRETARLDALVARKRRLIELLQEKRAAVISHAVTRGLDPAVPMKDSGVDWLGEVPAHWEVRRLRFVVSKIEQGWSPQCHNHKAENGEWGVLKVGCVNWLKFNPDENKALPEELEPRAEYLIQENDILMSRANTRELLGSAALVEALPETKLLLCDKLYRMRARPALEPAFLVFFMGIPQARFHFEREATGASGSMQNIGQDTVKDLPIVLPPVSEQQAILQHIQKSIARLTAIIERTDTAITTLQEYRTALITAAVTGKIDVREEGAC